MRSIAIMGLLVTLITASAGIAEVPPYLNYQGRLADSGGNPVQGTYNVTFSVYDTAAGGTPLWSETRSITTDLSGLFDVILGEVVPFDSFTFNAPNRWLGIAVESDPELTPRTQFLTVPYAARVGELGGSHGGLIHGDVTVEGDSVAVYGEVSSGLGNTAGVKGRNEFGTYGVRGESSGGPVPIGVSGYAQDGPTESYGVHGFAGGSGEEHWGVYGSAQHGSVNNYGVEGYVYAGDPGTHNYGVYGSSFSGSGTNYGVYASATYGETNYGLYAAAAGGTTNWAGYFNGDVYISGTLVGGGSGGGGGWTDDGTVVRLDTYTDEVGIGTTAPDAKLHVEAEQLHAAIFESNTGATDSAVVYVEFTGTGETDAVAVYGKSNPQDYWGIGGRFEGGYVGLQGTALPGGTNDLYTYVGVVGEARDGIGRNEGVRGTASNCWGTIGVDGVASNGSEYTIGVSGGSYSSSAPTSTGVQGTSVASGTFSYGVGGYAIDSPATWSYGVYGQAHSSPNANIGVGGSAQLNSGWKRGGSFLASGSGTNYGVYGYAWDGTTNYGVYGTCDDAVNSYAGFFDGDVHITGNLTGVKAGMRIDHPLDPENKYLQHAGVESSEMMNVYSGNVVTGSDGRAEVQLPDYFSALNHDFRYQLTVIGQFAQAIVLDKIRDNRFTIMTDKPNVEVSWQVTGIRNDPWAQAHPLEAEPMKAEHERDTYLNPELYGADETRATHRAPLEPSNEHSPVVTEDPVSRGQK